MRYKLLGRSGLRVSELCLGTMTFGEDWGWGASKDQSRRIFETFAEAGGNFVDTANNYTDGTSERFVGEFIATERERFVVSTKYTLSQRLGDPNASGNHRKSMVRALEASLRRLNTDYVDLFWLHMWDYTTQVEEILRALDDLVRAGKVLHIGISDTPAWVISKANAIADMRGWSRFVALQAEYSLLQRTAERDLLPMARDGDIAVLAFAVLEGGELTGKYNRATAEPKRNDQAGERSMALAEALIGLASEIGRTPAQIAINWVRQQRPGPIIPILGARTAEQLRDNLSCLEFELTDEQIGRLADVSPLELGFPHSFLALPHLRHLIYSGMFEQIDNRRI
jgi:aryl-alcohol dehydrogenase-like predicted oxidoreductase